MGAVPLLHTIICFKADRETLQTSQTRSHYDTCCLCCSADHVNDMTTQGTLGNSALWNRLNSDLEFGWVTWSLNKPRLCGCAVTRRGEGRGCLVMWWKPCLASASPGWNRWMILLSYAIQHQWNIKYDFYVTPCMTYRIKSLMNILGLIDDLCRHMGSGINKRSTCHPSHKKLLLLRLILRTDFSQL